jgi:hypothetical protein
MAWPAKYEMWVSLLVTGLIGLGLPFLLLEHRLSNRPAALNRCVVYTYFLLGWVLFKMVHLAPALAAPPDYF